MKELESHYQWRKHLKERAFKRPPRGIDYFFTSLFYLSLLYLLMEIFK